ncbi:MAG: NYN domain-containing protein [Nanoarchaeota archaeon]|nr:NYN domain-containing protein [Nanoarchaeota archaeon]
MEDKDKNKERVMIFIDGSNHYHLVKNMFKGSKRMINFNFEKFVNYIVESRKLVRIYYYNSPLDISYDLNSYMKQQQFFDKIQRIPNFELVLCRLQKQKIKGQTIYLVKEDDIHLAVDMVKFAYNNAYDTAILVSTDGDFVPAVLAVKEIGKNVENIGFETKFSYHLRSECDRFRKLNVKEVEKFFD